MATLSQVNVEQTESKMTIEEAAAELYKIVESHYDDLGLKADERDNRYRAAKDFLDAKDASTARI